MLQATMSNPTQVTVYVDGHVASKAEKRDDLSVREVSRRDLANLGRQLNGDMAIGSHFWLFSDAMEQTTAVHIRVHWEDGPTIRCIERSVRGSS